MKIMTWDGSLAVGLPTVDGQHEELVTRLNALSAAIAQGEGEREIQRTLTFLIDYTKYHFGEEEAIMAAASYPQCAEHRAMHREFIAILDRLEEEYREDGSTKILAESLGTLLANWLTGHIAKTDAQFAAFDRHSRT